MENKEMTYWRKKIILWVVVLVFFVGSIFIPELATFLGAGFVAVGGIQAVFHRAKEEGGDKLDEESVNFPLAWVGLGGVMVAGGAVQPLLNAFS